MSCLGMSCLRLCLVWCESYAMQGTYDPVYAERLMG